jgi:hypothetical protein
MSIQLTLVRPFFRYIRSVIKKKLMSCFRFSLDEKVDQSLPLDGLITRDEPLREMIQKLNIKKWVFTNAYRPVSYCGYTFGRYNILTNTYSMPFAV